MKHCPNARLADSSGALPVVALPGKSEEEFPGWDMRVEPRKVIDLPAFALSR